MTTQNPRRVKTGVVRLSYANIWKPRAAEAGQEPKYSVSLIIPKTDKTTLAAIKAASDEALKEGITRKWGGKKPANLKLPLRDGDVDRPDDEAYAGAWFLNTSAKKKPLILDADRNEVYDESEVYSGCYARAIIECYPFDVSGNRGVAVNLQAIQKIRDGEPLGGAQVSASDFDDEDDI